MCYVPSAVSKYSRSGLSHQVLSVTDIPFVVALLLVERRGRFLWLSIVASIESSVIQFFATVFMVCGKL